MSRPVLHHILRAAAVTALAVSPAIAQTPASPPQPKPPGVEGIFTLGGLADDTSGAAQRVGEYEMVRPGGVGRLGGELWGDRGALRFDVQAQYGGTTRDQFYRADFNYARWLKVHVDYQRFPHRLDHDPLSYVDAGSGIGGTFIVTHSDTDPSAQYSLTHGQLDARVEIAPPSLRGLRFFASHRQERREGMRQSLTTSHCSTCHVVSYSRGVDQATRDLSGGARFSLRHFGVEYAFTDRRFSERTADLTNVYGLGVQPATLADVFLNRLQFDARAGALPFDVIPASKKQTHLLKAHAALPGGASADGTFTRSDVLNRDTTVGYTYTGGTGRFLVPFGRRFALRGTVRKYEIEADDVFVDVVEQVSPAGLTAGLTYAQAYPTFGNPDFMRRSTLARSPTDAAIDLTWTPAKRTSVQAGYTWQEVERSSFEVEKTTTNTLTLRGRSRPWKPLELRTRFQYDWITDPFTYERAAVPAILQPFQSPNNVPFTGLQYYQMYDSRQANLTSYPSRSARFDQSVVWSPTPRVSVNAHYRVNSSRNDELNFSTWSRTAHAPGAELWIAPGDRWSLMAGYTATRERLDTLFSTLAFVG